MTLNGITKYLAQAPEFKNLKKELNNKKVSVGGLNSGGKGIFLSSVFESSDRPLLVITPSLQEAEILAKDIASYIDDADQVIYFPSLDVFSFEDVSPDKELVGKRLCVLDSLLEKKNIIIVAPIKAVAERTIPKHVLKENRLHIRSGDKVKREGIISDLVKMGYTRQVIVGERGELSVRGAIIDIFSPCYDEPVRIELLDDNVESMRFFDPVSQISLRSVQEVRILPVREILLTSELRNSAKNLHVKDDSIDKIMNGVYFDGMEYYAGILYEDFTSLAKYLPNDAIVFFDDKISIENTLNKLLKESDEIKKGEISHIKKLEQVHGDYLSFDDIISLIDQRTVLEKSSDPKVNISFHENDNFYGKLDILSDWVRQNQQSKSIFIVSKQASRLFEILSEKGINCFKQDVIPEQFKKNTYIIYEELSSGFSYSDIIVISDKEIFSRPRVKERYTSQPKEGVSSKLLSDLNIGDYVVHANHGIGTFRGLEKLRIGGAEQEYIEIEYAADDKLYVPLHLMGMVQKYSSLGEHKPKINRLGGTEWARTKAKAKKSIKDLTNDLISIYSSRKRLKGHDFPPDGLWQIELEQSFPYEETPDQEMAVMEVKKDMESDRPMDRLVCGDVGYGKTEVAIRAAFKAAAAGKQVAVLVPTTVLAEQHFRNFSKRFESFPLVVEMLSRFRSKSEQESIIRSLAAGAIDIIIGTHRLLQKDIKFKDLGFLIIDEEQRFGVAHKEKIKKLKTTIDVLTLTATPIPRTLYMAISGARDMSMINTPPLDRSPIKTYLYEWNEAVIHEAILRELERGGQVYFVYNIVKDIGRIAELVKKLVPAARVAVAHGQMDEKGLESVMIDFMNRKYDVLVCSTIIESGIDIPSVNTIIIDHAEKLGLSQLYQLRGRVGRSSVKAYSYLLYHKDEILTDLALERLKAIQEFSALGSGYKLAMKDLEIRGAGNILGAEQHGHIISIGFDLYCELLEESVKEIKRLPEEERKRTYIDLKVDAFIPDLYVPDEKQRIALYRRMNFIDTYDELNELKKELQDRYGRIPDEVGSLLEIVSLKIDASKKNIDSIEGGPNSVKITFRDQYDQQRLRGFMNDIVVYDKVVTLKSSNFTGGKWFDMVKKVINAI